MSNKGNDGFSGRENRTISGTEILGEEVCVTPEKIIPDANTRFDFTKMQLFISIPQASLHNQARGYIEPSLWDEGINAALLNYNFSGGVHSPVILIVIIIS